MSSCNPAHGILTYIFLGALAGGCCTINKPSAPPKPTTVSEVVAAIQKAIDPFWDVKDPPLSSVKVALQTVHDDKLSAEVDYLVIAVSGYYENAKTEELDLTLAPKPPGVAPEVVAQQDDITAALHDAIVRAQQQVAKTYRSMNGHVLETKEIDVQIAFAVTWDVKAGVNKWAISPISVTASNEFSSKNVNTITVVFKRP